MPPSYVAYVLRPTQLHVELSLVPTTLVVSWTAKAGATKAKVANQ